MKRRDVVFLFCALAGAMVYVACASARGVVGFALDDAWIHQVYARNLAMRGEFAFFAGQPSAGSTSPLWTILLALGYLIQIDWHLWAYLLGALFLGLSAILATRLVSLLAADTASRDRIALCAGLFVLLEWHLAWSAVSGMEIVFFVFLSLLLLERFYAGARVLELGLVGGLLVLTRPEGVILDALVGLGILLRHFEDGGMAAPDFRARILREAAGYGAGLAVLILPYLAFNLAVSGTILPNTFYAKNVEYASLLDRAPLLVRWAQLLFAPLIGAQFLLLPGLVLIVVRLAARRQWSALLGAAWILLLPALYAIRLPVVYQYGRYEMPIIPFLGLYGVWGTFELAALVGNRILRRTWAMSAVALLIVFWVIGATRYASDVAIIDCEMVQTAQWTAANTPPGRTVAAHDIGALGYYYRRPVIDLAGLVSPEVIPIMRDQARLREFLVARGVSYAIFFPDWYPALAADPSFVPVHRSNCPVAREAGGTDMGVYEIVR